MNSTPNPLDRDDVETLVSAYLRGKERTVDATRILAGVRSRQARPTPRRPVRGLTRSAVGVAAAVILAVGFASTFRQTTAYADALKLVQQARAALDAGPTDRAYRIGIDLAPGMAERAPYLAALAHFDCRLWARPDRFWIEGSRGSQVWACGRDERRHVWIAGERQVGIDFGPEDIPEPLDAVLDLFQFDLDSTLQLLSTDFDVATLAASPAGPPGVTRIQGTPRAEHPRPHLRSITVEIDDQTKIVRQVVLSRLRGGHRLAEVSFTFDGAANQPDAAYGLAAHLEADAPIRSADDRLRRRRALTRFFGSLLLKGE